MVDLIKYLSEYMDSNFERIARQTKWKLYFERLKANNVKEVFRVDFQTKTVKYYCVEHNVALSDILLNCPTDEVQFNTVEEIVEYIYGA